MLSRIYDAIKNIGDPMMPREERLGRLRVANEAANEIIKRRLLRFAANQGNQAKAEKK